MILPSRSMTTKELNAFLEVVKALPKGTELSEPIYWVENARNFGPESAVSYKNTDQELALIMLDRMVEMGFKRAPFLLFNSPVIGGWVQVEKDTVQDYIRAPMKTILAKQATTYRAVNYVVGNVHLYLGICVRCGQAGKMRAQSWTGAEFPISLTKRLMYPADESSAIHTTVRARVAALAGSTANSFGSYLPWLSGLCKGCETKWACSECATRCAFDLNDPSLLCMLSDLRCTTCVGTSLTAIKPPKLNRSELRALRGIVHRG